MDKIKKFLSNLRFLFVPSYWQMNNKYNREWDKELNDLLDGYVFHRSMDGGFTAVLGDKRLWIQNHPYGSFMPYYYSGLKACTANFRASRLTILRAYKQYIKETNPYDAN